jgi:F-type H+-transporting ATPase subunit b
VVIDIDASIVIQFALILFLWFTLNKLVFQPYLATSQARQAKTDDTRAEALKLRARVDALHVEHKARWSAARDEADAARAVLRDAGAREREALVSAARAQSRKTVEAGNARVAEQLKAAQGEVGARTAEIAQAVVDKILGRGL